MSGTPPGSLVTNMRLWAVVSTGLIAGLLAGVVWGLFAIEFSTPLIIEAERYEVPAGQEHTDTEASGGRRNVGTVLGTVVLGSIFGLFLSVVFNLTVARRAVSYFWAGLGLGGLFFLTISLVPSLVFPPSPPGVEFTASVAVRQGWWAGIIFLEITGLFAYRQAYRHFGPGSKILGHGVGLALFALIVSLLFIIGPPNQVEQMAIPKTLLSEFQAVFIATMLLFWGVLGLLVGWLSGWHGRDEIAA